MANALCLDITRTVSRLGRGHATGIDRVEQAYLTHLLSAPRPLFLLLRTDWGLILFGPENATAVHDYLAEATSAGSSGKGRAIKARAEAFVRRKAVARAPRFLARHMFRRHVPPGTTLLNVGHANLDRTVLAGWRSVPSSRVAVMLHDTIPLDFPDFQRKGSAARFAQTLSVIARFADCVLTPSKAAGAAARRWFPITGNLPEIHVAPLGIDIAKPDQSALPSDLTLKQPYFVTVGTIEPRKNHALLLKVWRDFPTKMRPQLLIIGRRGWRNERVFNALDQGKSDDIVECADLCDSAVSYLLTHCAGALFPSFAEGYGLAPIEAACLGAPLICADLAVTRETLGNIPVYVDPSDVYLWRQNIIRLAAKNRAGRDSWRVLKAPPTWEAHFNQVMSLL